MKPEISIEQLRKAVQRMPEDGLTATRLAALERIDEYGLPTLRDEDWKYTDLGPAIDISNRWLASGATNPATDELKTAAQSVIKSIDANWLIIANGRIDLGGFDDSADIDISRMSESAAPFTLDRPLADLNAALLEDGLKIEVHGATEKPLGILLIDRANDAAAVAQSNIEVHIAPGCDAELVEYHHSAGDGDQYSNSVISVEVGESARLRHVRIQNRRPGHVHTGRFSALLGRNSELVMSGYDLGGGLVRNDVDIDIAEPGSTVSFNGLYLAGNGQHIDNHTRVDHRVGPAHSSQEYRGILGGRCRAVWNGKAIVHEGADGTDANQSNHNLLLSEHAEIDAKPELEIYADDVKCSHGTTVGQLDETALFYLRSRGLGRQQALQVLTHAFAVDLVGKTPVAATRDVISALVEERLKDLLQDDSP